MRSIDIIIKKRDKQELSPEEIDFFVQGYTRGEITDYQASAWAMAVLLNGMTARETTDLTLSMARSGQILDLADIVDVAVDKHSTGGVGDKTTLAVLPIVAACGLPCGKMSGRGLGFSGGTLDKLESIPGYRVNLSTEEFKQQLKEIGIVLTGQSLDLAPADGKFYALRDVTGTVQSIPLIASSIMSKKIAEGTSALVLDVKTGAGAFMSDPEKAKELAHVMVGLGKRAGVKTIALVTAMDIPLGLTAGNALEVRESVEVLAGGGPADIVELTVLLAREMLEIVGITHVDPADALKNGKAMDVWRQMISAQGGDPDAKLPRAKENLVITAQSAGTILSMDAMKVGMAAWRLGAGRSRQGEAVQAGAGIEIHAKPGDVIAAGAPLYTLHTDTPAAFERAQESLTNSVTIGDLEKGAKIDRLPLIVERITD